jgi:type II secretory pathway component GspD/PulD (secretin)
MKIVTALAALGLACGFFAAVPAAQAQGRTKDAAAIRKALDEKVTLDYNAQSLQDALDHLSQKTKIKFVLDNNAMMNGMMMPGFGPGGVPPGPGGFPGMQLSLKSDNGKLRTALSNMLAPLHLSYFILSDTVLISEEFGWQRQMRQRVSVDVKDLSLSDALRKLADETGVNLVIDTRQNDKARTKISLQLDDTTVETAMRLLSDLADLSAVRVGNVMLVTTESRAEKFRKENRDAFDRNPYGGIGGIVGAAVGGFPPPAIEPIKEVPPVKEVPKEGK